MKTDPANPSPEDTAASDARTERGTDAPLQRRLADERQRKGYEIARATVTAAHKAGYR
jgi:hypothetical protein